MNKQIRVAIVGSGPSGMYSVEHLLNAAELNVEIDLFERLPTPWGLVRGAVAPDHPAKKQVIDSCFSPLMGNPRVRFFGNVEIGTHIQVAELADWYDAVIYASGASSDTHLGIPGEELPGCLAAREMVQWYNGHPDFSQLDIDLSCERAVVVGNGNVALDVARILTTPLTVLEKTDMANGAIEALRRSAIKEVVVMARRGYMQAAYHYPELEEFEFLDGVEVTMAGEELCAEDAPMLKTADWETKIKAETLRRVLARKVEKPRKRIVLQFLCSPIEVLGTNKVEGIRVARNKLIGNENTEVSASATGEEFTLEASLVLRSIGFRGQPFPGLPFDQKRHVLNNRGGRIVDNDDNVIQGHYTTGWLKRGPRGLIGTNKQCAAETVGLLLEDTVAGLFKPACQSAGDVANMVRQRQPDLVEKQQWYNIDNFERTAAAQGRPRAKLTTTEALLNCAFAR